jgi:uncharacterized protein
MVLDGGMGVTTTVDVGASATKPVPLVDEASRDFWEGAREHRLVIQQCEACHHHLYPPAIVCKWCLSEDLMPRDVSGRGTLYAFATVNQAFHVGFVDDVPYVVGYVDLDEEPGVQIITNIVGASPDELKIGMPLEVVFDDRNEYSLPQFRPVPA